MPFGDFLIKIKINLLSSAFCQLSLRKQPCRPVDAYKLYLKCTFSNQCALHEFFEFTALFIIVFLELSSWLHEQVGVADTAARLVVDNKR